MSLTFICQVFYPDEQATSQLFSDLFGRIARRSGSIEVLAGFPAGGHAGVKVPRSEVWSEVLIRRGGLRLNFKASMLSRAMGYGGYSLWLTWRLLVCTPSRARLLVATNPPFAPVLVYLCALLRDQNYDVILLDVYPDGLVAVGGLRESSVIARIWRWFNRRALARADRVLVLGRDMAALCRSRYAVPEDKLLYTPHWSPMVMDGRKRAEDTRLWRSLKLEGKFVVQYSGNMGLWHDIETIVRAAVLLQMEPRVQFLMIGTGMRRKAAERLCAELGVTNMMWLPYQPKEALEDSLSCCHAALISQRAGLAGVAVPCKIYGILASGRAVLAQVPTDSEVAQVLREEKCGLVIEPGDPMALAAAIRQLADGSMSAENMGLRAFEAYRAKYTVEVATDTFLKILHDKVAARPAV
jgi:glycosyltransferase involved in cell wall biosynthesis